MMRITSIHMFSFYFPGDLYQIENNYICISIPILDTTVHRYLPLLINNHVTSNYT